MSALRQHYEQHGFTVARHVVDDHTVQFLRQHLATCDVAPNGLVPLRQDADPVAQTLARDPRLLTLAAEVLGEPADLFALTYVVKPARSPWRVAWHQDGEPWRRQWGIERAVTLWLALDASGPDNGGLRMVPGSHRGILLALERVDDPFDVFGWASPRDPVHELQAVDVVLEVGDVSAHHPAMVHASGPNRSDGPRRALSLRFRAA